MKFLKLNLEDNTNAEKVIDLLLMIKGVKSVEIVDDSETESDLKKAFSKTKEQLQKGDYETLVNDFFETFLNKKS